MSDNDYAFSKLTGIVAYDSSIFKVKVRGSWLTVGTVYKKLFMSTTPYIVQIDGTSSLTKTSTSSRCGCRKNRKSSVKMKSSFASFLSLFLFISRLPINSLPSLTHSLTYPLFHSPHLLMHSHTYTPTLPLTHSLTHPPTLSLSPSLTLSLAHSLTHPPTHPLSHSFTHPLTYSHTRPLSLPHSSSLLPLTHQLER